MDDRDAGVVALGGRSLLVSWFTSDTRKFYERTKTYLPLEEIALCDEALSNWSDEMVKEWLGSWVILSDDCQNWSAPISVPVSTPHSPIKLANGGLLYLGKAGFRAGDQHKGEITACSSTDGGRNWEKLGTVPIAEGTQLANYHEPHVVELENGRLIGMIRFQHAGEDDPARHLLSFCLYQTESDDGGLTWTQARDINVYGSPPQLLRHSSGTLICVFGYRQPPYGERAILSKDGGETWETEVILRDDGPDGDLGYPASVEMPDGSIFTVYYQKYQAGERCSLLWTRWELP